MVTGKRKSLSRKGDVTISPHTAHTFPPRHERYWVLTFLSCRTRKWLWLVRLRAAYVEEPAGDFLPGGGLGERCRWASNRGSTSGFLRHIRSASFIENRCSVTYCAVGPWNRPKCDVQAIPTIDSHNGKREIDQFHVGEMLPHLLIDFAGSVPIRNERHGLGPGENSPLPLCVKRCFPPSIQKVKSLLAFIFGAKIF